MSGLSGYTSFTKVTTVNIDACKQVLHSCALTVKGDQARLNQATTKQAESISAAQAALKAAITDSLSGVAGAEDAKAQAKEALKAAMAPVTGAEEALKASKAEEEKARQTLNQHLAARSVRAGKGFHHKYDPATAALEELTLTETVSAYSFLEQAKIALADISTMESFPEPKATPCGTASCLRNKSNRAMEACSHNIQAAFAGSSTKQLREAKNTFRPSRFAAKSDSEAKAYEICAVLDKMIQCSTVVETPRGKNMPKNQKQASNHNGKKLGR